GKTTLVKILLGTEQPTRGGLTLGHNVRPSYFSQHAADGLPPDRSVIECLTDITDMTETEARNYLARFLFTGDDVFKRVGMLSGGEKNKLALARMIVEPCNLLILDEPTNHLDIASCEALTGMLAHYDGTLLLVSHDRYLLNATTTKTLALSGSGTGTLFEGNYAAWREAERQAQATPKKPANAPKPVLARPTAPAVVPPAPTLNPRELSKARVKARETLLTAESAVHALETRIAEVEARLARPSGAVADMIALAAEHTRLQDDLTVALSQWEQAVAAQETLGF
ncbi:MAG: ATP-binding cassette domain-containing protein, partial [Armatimonadota bacterium]|nr:ATP-binding cassette domain-containing protein [Armatimonadota bacterium]